MRYDVKSIMKKAWEIYHAADQGDGLKPVFSMCLKMAWANEKGKPCHIRSRWDSMSDGEKIQMVRKYAKKAAHFLIRHGDTCQLAQDIAFSKDGVDLDGIVNETWCILIPFLSSSQLSEDAAKRSKSGKMRKELEQIVLGCGCKAIRRMWKLETMPVSETQPSAEMEEDGLSLEDLIQDLKADTERTAHISTAFDDYAKKCDQIDRLILHCRGMGYTMEEIGMMAGISAVAICKRIGKIKRDLRKLGLAPGAIQRRTA